MMVTMSSRYCRSYYYPNYPLTGLTLRHPGASEAMLCLAEETLITGRFKATWGVKSSQIRFEAP